MKFFNNLLLISVKSYFYGKYKSRAGLCTSCGSGHWRGYKTAYPKL